MEYQSRLNISHESLLSEGAIADNRIVYRPGHDYLSLMSPLSLLDPNYLEIVRRYIQSRPSSIRQSVSHFYKRHRPRRKKRNREESLREFEDIFNRFWKLQIKIGLLFVITIALIVTLVLIHPRLRFKTAEKGNDLFVGDGDNTSFQLCTKCKPLQSMKGISENFITDIESSSHEGFCCFRRVDQIISLFKGYAETYVDQEIKKVREETKGNLSSLIDDMMPRPFPLAHFYFKETEHTVSNVISPLNWETRGLDILFQGDVSLQSQQRVIVPKTGVYYIYNSLELDGTTNHSLMKDGERLLGKVSKGGNSELQGVFRLSESDSVWISASQVKGGMRRNYFGIYFL